MASPTGASTVLAWGSREDGQLGVGGDEEDWAHCVEALEPYNVTAVVAGSRNSLAICDDVRLFTWGWNERGTLGHPPETKTESSPGPVDALAGVRIVQAAIGGCHCLAVDDKGRAYAWGGNEYGQCGEELERKEDGTRALRNDIIPTPQRCAAKFKVRQVAAGGTHSVVLTQEGHVWTWGQPWPPGDIKQISTPVLVQGLQKVWVIAAGAFHNFALTEDGRSSESVGNNEYGQLDIGDTQPRSQPIRIEGLSDILLVHNISANEGEVYAWGRGEHKRLGFGDDKSSQMVPLKVELLAGEGILQVPCGESHSVALTRDGRMFSVAAGGIHSVVLTQGHVWTWGQPWRPDDIKQISTPIRVQGLQKARVIASVYSSWTMLHHNHKLDKDSSFQQMRCGRGGLGKHAKNTKGCGIRHPIGVRKLKKSFLGVAKSSMGVDHSKFPRYWTHGDLLPANPPMQNDGTCAVLSLCITVEMRYLVDHKKKKKKKQTHDKIEIDMAWVKKICKKAGILSARYGSQPSWVLDLIMKIGGIMTRKCWMQGAEVDIHTLIPIQYYLCKSIENMNPSDIIYELYVYGPVVGDLLITDDYMHGPERLYRGCPIPLDGVRHFVLCYGYQWIHEKLHLEILDNISTAAGSFRVVPFDAFDHFVFPYV